MLSFSLPLDVYLCVPSADMRRSFDGLIRMAELRNTEGHSQTTLTPLLPDLWPKSNPNAYRLWSR